MSIPSEPTPYEEVNAVLDLLLSNVRSILGSRFIGLYLYGSLASGHFDPETSDIDFLAVTEGELPDEMLPVLEAMHARLAVGGRCSTSYARGGHRCSKIPPGCAIGSVRPSPC